MGTIKAAVVDSAGRQYSVSLRHGVEGFKMIVRLVVRGLNRLLLLHLRVNSQAIAEVVVVPVEGEHFEYLL